MNKTNAEVIVVFEAMPSPSRKCVLMESIKINAALILCVGAISLVIRSALMAVPVAIVLLIVLSTYNDILEIRRGK
jgi:hypothetical protein